MYSILHISDLHRSIQEPISNDTLLSSLLNDRDRYLMGHAAVRSPDAIVVSGDLIHGVRLGTTGWEAEIRSQYEVARDFLARLTDRFLSGDRSKVIIVPGNHDVCWNTAIGSMTKVPDAEYATALKKFGTQQSAVRWSWDDRAFFEISDQSKYAKRLDAYWDTVQRFYEGTAFEYPISRSRGYNLFELMDGAIIVAAFETTSANDCFSTLGYFESSRIGACDLKIRDSHKPYRLRIAVWHHSIYGLPEKSDYLPISSVHQMIGCGFRVGLHGHQHIAEAVPQYINTPDKEEMAIISAGSLCAGANELPPGINRQYNMIIINDDLKSGRVHVREMVAGSQFSQTRNLAFAPDGYLDLTWAPPTDPSGRALDHMALSARKRINDAEAALKAGKFLQALEILRRDPLDPGTLARKLAIAAAENISDWASVLRIGNPPSNADELVAVVEALRKLSEFDRALAAIEDNAHLGLSPTITKQLLDRINLDRKMKGK